MQQEKATKILDAIKGFPGLISVESKNNIITVYVDNTQSYEIIKDPLKQFLNADVFCVSPVTRRVKMTQNNI